MQKLSTILLHGAALGAILLPANAVAQEVERGAGLADIIVTAQRRAESLQDVPISVTAADAAQLTDARVINAINITAVSPSITFGVANIPSSSANVIIRGLGTSGNSRAFEGSVGVFIDGVYRTRPGAALQDFLDIGNLQILKGPQGTLFGKNTTAGAILLTSTAPELGEFGGMVDIGYGNYNTSLVRAAANAPIGSQLAVRVGALVSHRDGFFRNPTTGNRFDDNSTQAIKGQLLWEPVDGVSVRLIGDYSESNGNCCYGTSDFIDGPTQALIDGLTMAWGGVVPPRDGKLHFEQTLNGDGHGTVKDYGATLLIDADVGGGTLKSVTAWRKYGVDQRDMDPDFTGADLFRISENFHSRFISQELTYNAHVDALNADLLLGAFFSDEKLDMGRELPWASQGQAFWDVVFGPGVAYAAPGLWAVEAMRGTARSYAGFAHLDVALSDKFNVIAGVRYSIENKTGAFHNPFYRPQANDVFRVLGLQPGPAYASKTTDKAVSGTFGLQYRPTSDVMLYATYNRGFKAGGVNLDANAAGGRAGNPDEVPGAVPSSPDYRPEKVDAFEVGAKMEYLNHRARTNIALFYYSIHDLQVAQFLGLQFAVINARSAKDYGAEITNLFELTEGLTLGLDGTWLPHAKYGIDPQLSAFLSGQRFRGVPKFRGNATLSLDQPVGTNFNLTGRVQYQYAGAILANSSSFTERDSVGLLNGNIGFRLPQSGLSIEAWGLNLANKTYLGGTFSTTLQTGDENAFMGMPRTFGVRLHMDF